MWAERLLQPGRFWGSDLRERSEDCIERGRIKSRSIGGNIVQILRGRRRHAASHALRVNALASMMALGQQEQARQHGRRAA